MAPLMVQFPITLRVFQQFIQLHLVMEMAAFFVGFRYFLWLRNKKGDSINSSNRTSILIGAIFGALIGSRLIGCLEDPTALRNSQHIWLYIYSNKTVLGGFLGGLLGVELAKWFIGEKTSSGDLFTYPMILALIIGRIGCFSMGVYESTYGTPTHFFTGINLGDGIARHPVALYEMGFLVLLWIGLTQLKRRAQLANGSVFKIFMMAYLVYRFAQEFIKPSPIVLVGLSTIQLTAIAGLLYYYRYLLHPKLLLQSHA